MLRHVPKAARGAWAQCLARALAQVAGHNSLRAWRELLILPKTVLRPAPRGGARRREQAARFTQRCCARWLEGERGELWSESPARRPKQASEEDEAAVLARRHARCISLAGEGELSRACAALVDPPLLAESTEVLNSLRAKHPHASPARPGLQSLGPSSRRDVPDISSAEVLKAVRGFRRGSAPGPTGLRGDHVREALSTAHADEVTAHLTEVIRILVRGEAPLELAPHLAGATLHAMPKGGDDVRPIAVGETWRRLAGKCLCSSLREAAAQNLWPLQVGVAVPLGTETAIHTARQWMQRNTGHADKCFLQVDFRNAFNTIDRAAMLRQVRLHMPGLAPWAEWCYDHHSRLLFHHSPLLSEAGVQQGDPLGPLLFALTLQPALRAAAAGAAGQAPELTFAFLDDACLAGGSRQVAAGLTRLAAAGRQVGLELSPSKCVLTVCAGPDGTVDRRAFPAGIQVNHTGATCLLGAPIGPQAYTEDYTRTKRVEKATLLLQALQELPDPQTALLLLRHCAAYCRMVFALRVTPPQLLAGAACDFDSAVRACLEHFCTGPLPSEAWLQASLSTANGGLGLRHAARHAAAAYTASLSAVLQRCLALDPSYLPAWPLNDITVTLFNGHVLAADRLPTPVPPTVRQQQLSQALDRAAVQQLLTPGPNREAFRANLQLQRQPRAGAWLQAVPSEALGLSLAPDIFRVLVKLRLRLPIATEDVACPLCDGVADRFGDHALSCPCGGDRTKRHNRLRTVLAARAQAAGLHPEVEKPGLLPPRSEQDGLPEDGVRHGPGRRPADVYVPLWGVHGPAAFDLAVTAGLRLGTLQNLVSKGADHVVLDYEAHKRSHLQTQDQCTAQGLQFIPLVVECRGGWGPAAAKAWQALAAAIAAQTGEPVSVEASRLYETLAVTLQRENARAVLRRVPASGQDPGPAALFVEP